MLRPHSNRVLASLGETGSSRIRAAWLPWALALAAGFVAYLVVGLAGVSGLVIVLAGLATVAILGAVSFRDLSLATIGWFIAMGPVRRIGMVSMPILPDISIDRVMLVWIVAVLLIRVVLVRRSLPGPYTADILVGVQAVYIWVQMQILSDPVHVHNWVLSTLSPLFAFVYGKYAVEDAKFVRNVLLFLLASSVYYYITMIAEQFDAYGADMAEVHP